jgi:hypothetical protein
MEMVRVYSSAISAIGYDPETRRMKVRFITGVTYDFCRVPPDVVDRFMKSPSKGGFYNSHIRDRYPC